MATQVDDGLSPREREVIQLVARGKANKEIALALGVSEATVSHGRLSTTPGASGPTVRARWRT